MKLENFSLKKEKEKMKYFKVMMVRKYFNLFNIVYLEAGSQTATIFLEQDKITSEIKV